MTPRPPQLACFAACRDAFRRGLKRIAVEMATGMGKTIIFCHLAEMARAKGGKTLILVNRDNLARQAGEKYHRVAGVYPSFEKAEEKGSRHAPVVVGSIQTMQGKRLAGWSPDQFRLVITDEVHGAAAKSFRNVLTHFGNAWHIGFSATIERADGQGIGWFYQDVAYRFGLLDAVREGWLVGPTFSEVPVPVEVDPEAIKKKRWSEEDEARALAPYVERIIEELSVALRGRKALVFWPTCAPSRTAAEMFALAGLNARHVDSTYMPASETASALSWFARVTEGVLCNASLLTTGYDQPDIDTVVIARLVKSTPFWTQMVGRGTRPVANVDGAANAEERRRAIAMSTKPELRVLDLLIQGDSHDIVRPSCLISTLHDEQDGAVKRALAAGGPVTLEALANGLSEHKRIEQEALEKLAAVKAQRERFRASRAEHPYVADIFRCDDPWDEPATPKQVAFLARLGFALDAHPELRKRQASRVIGRYVSAREARA